ncbi:transcription factor 20 [Ditylenchus destructor]|nr:transcription factor 20 [Ditylenchus destructor]
MNTSSKKKSLRKNKRKTKKAKSKRDDGNAKLIAQLNARYGKGKKDTEEVLTATVNPTVHPSNYERAIARATETHLNRLSQPESPADLIKSIWLCALCQNRSCFDGLGDLYGPYYAKAYNYELPKFLGPSTCEYPTSSTSALKEELVPAPKFTKTKKAKLNSPPTIGNMNGSVDLWFHGNCVLWAPELFLIGGQIAGLSNFMNQYWSQKCDICLKIGATIKAANNCFIHYPCAIEKGYQLNELTFTCLPPKH